MASHFETILRNGLSQPATRLSTLEMFSPKEKEELEKARTERKDSRRRQLKAVKPKGVRLTEVAEND
jgi:hypothetical protein